MRSVGQLAVKVKALSLDDSLGKAAEAVRASTVGAAPVIRHGILIGLATAEAIAEAIADVMAARPGEVLVEPTVALLHLSPAIALPDGFSPADALRFFEANGLHRAPVVDGCGAVLGMVSRAELASGVCGRVRPPHIGGMATPFGVYLTGGGVRGGVGDLALMTTGMYLGALTLLAIVLAQCFFAPGGWGVAALGLIDARLFAPHGWDTVMPALAHSPDVLFNTVWLSLFALFFRLSWITGYHAAEHQVVHTIEAGDDLLPEVVREKPRVHPRCGTNLVAAVGIMSVFWHSPGLRSVDLQPILAMLVTAFLWRRVGGLIQQHVTTRPASPAQLESGIRAGRELMERYQMQTSPPVSLPARIWNMGLLQVMAGWFILLCALGLLQLAGVPLPEALRFF